MLAQGTTTTTAPSDPATDLIGQLTGLDDTCGDDPTWACRQVYERTGNEVLAGMAEWFVAKPLTILIIVAVAFVASPLSRRLIKRSTQRMLAPRAQERHRRLRDRTPNVLLRSTEEWSLRTEARVHTLTAVLQSVASVAIWFVALVWVLGVLAIDFGPLIAGAGIAGVALGFGAQNVVRDFLAGFFMVVEDQLGVGDVVDLGPPVSGTVEKVTLRSTRIRSADGTVWHVPNGQVLRVGNKSQEWARALLDVVVAYDTDLDQAQAAIGDVARGLRSDPLLGPEITADPEVWGIEELTAEGVVIRLVVKTRPGSQWKVMRELRRRLLAEFRARGVLLPHADLTVRLATDDPTPAPDPEDPGDPPTPS